MKLQNIKIEQLYKFLSRMSKKAYKDELLISNVVFSKQESRALILEAYLAGDPPPRVSFLFIVKKISLYLVKNIFYFIQYLLTALLHQLSRQKFRVEDKDKLILVDSYFAVSNILGKGEIEDIYLPGLSEYLTKRKKAYVYIPRWFGSKRPFDLFRVFRILKKTRLPVLTQFQVLGLIDYLKTLRFLILYPFSIFRFMKILGSSYEDRLISYGLWDVFDGGVIEHYMRFLMGKKLSSMMTGRIKCFSWYENLVTDKNFYLGLRTSSQKTEIIGVQLFVRPNTLMNIVPDEEEVPFKVVPDRILVNGSGYLFKSNQLRVDVGPALRYKHLFNSDLKIHSRKVILVILPYWEHIVNHILDVIQKVDWPAPIVIKFHPTMDSKKYKIKILKNFSVTNEALPLLFPRVLSAVGHGGALIEAAALGIPVVNIQHPDRFCHDYMPEIGKGILWGRADRPEEIELLIKQFHITLQENPEQLKEEGIRMKSFCFSEPTEEMIAQAFEID